MESSGEQFADVGRGIELCYETFGSREDPPVLLVMGLGMQLLGWLDDFCAEIAGEGFHVVRFDNRDTGRSTSVDSPPPGLPQLATRRFAASQYTLEDMADDAAGLLDALDLAPAHVVGASLGGMIAQTLAHRHPRSVRTLTTIMSTTGSRLKGRPEMALMRVLLQRAPDDRDSFVEHFVKVFELIGSPELGKDADETREQAGRSFDRGTNPAGTGRQLGAILKSGDRTKALRGVKAPTLVIHGTKDRLVRPSGGKATAEAIPGAELMLVEGMGHDLPRAVWPQVVSAIVRRAHRYDGALQTA